ncbi:MAG: phosphatidate cytidylyltransferase [Candidatus Gastranaerophilales bacterium]|nr:phosphatidate cytidylyltransferase [Candidatus Gastranaerophilales bacterium]
MNNKDIRIITAWIFLIITFAIVYAGGWWMGAFIIVLMLFGMKELLNMLHSKDLYPSRTTSYIGGLLFIFLGCIGKIQYLYLATIFLVIAAFMAILFRGKNARIKDVGATLLTVVYGGLLPSHFLFMRNMDAGTVNLAGFDVSLALCFVVTTVSCITVTDVVAYFAGCKFGKHKLWEEVSPKKTIEGSLSGAICTILLALLLGNDMGFQVWQSVSLGLIITIFAQLGDLVESMMKRDAGAKDASDILPGHGGLLDRADSYIFTVAVTYYFLYFVIVNPIF